jgi:hypothetical protein
MIAVRNWFPHGCCGPNGCDDAACVLCANVASIDRDDDADVRLTEASNADRDGDPKLAAERKRGNKAFRPSHRAGPNYVPRNARV